MEFALEEVTSSETRLNRVALLPLSFAHQDTSYLILLTGRPPNALADMSKPLSRKYVEDYESDGGFVEDAPKSKKQKSEPKQTKTGVHIDDEGNEYWEVRQAMHR